jgi:hypothetical protein
MRHQHRLAAKKARLPPRSTNASTASRVASLQYSSWPPDAQHALAVGAVERGDFAPVARHVGGAAPVVGQLGHRAALAVDDHHRGVAKRRRVEHAVHVRLVVRNAGAPAVGGEAQRGRQFLVVVGQVARFLVRRKALDHHVDRALGPRQVRAVDLAQVAELAPVVLAARQAFFLDRPQQARAPHQADAGVLGPVDAEYEGCIDHRRLLLVCTEWSSQSLGAG